MTDIIFSTIHGSLLYGLAHGGSDVDMFYVTNSVHPNARHSFTANGIDQTRIGLNVFLHRIQEGSHQSVEALFSPIKQWSPEYEYLRPMLDSYRIGGAEVFAKYERTVTKFCYGDFKRRRHAVRLNQNLQSLRKFGRFDPVMDKYDILVANNLATELEGDDLREALEEFV